MTDTATGSTERAHRAAKRYIYAWGDGRAEGDATMRDLLGGKGAGLAEMTIAGLPVPPGFTITTEACNDYFAAGEQLPDGLWDDVLEAVRGGRARDRQGLRRRRQPAPRQRPLGRQVLDARDDGHGPQPRAQRADAARPDRADRQRALRLGRLPPVHPDVRPDRDGRRRASASTTPSTRPRRAHGADAGHRPGRGGPARGRRRVQGDRREPTPGATSRADPYDQLDLAIKAVFASWFGKRAHDYRENQKIAHDLGTAVNVVTMVFGNMGDDSGTGVAFTRDPNTGEKELYGEYLTNAQGEDVVAGIRTPQKISHLAQDLPERVRRVPADRRAARAPLPRRPGPRVHDRARPAVHAPDAEREADRRGGGEDRHRHGRRGRDHQGGGGRADRAGPRRPAPPRPVRPGRAQDRRPASPRASTRRRARRSAGRSSRPTTRSTGSTGARRSSSSGSRPRPTTSTAWPSPRAS